MSAGGRNSADGDMQQTNRGHWTSAVENIDTDLNAYAVVTATNRFDLT